MKIAKIPITIESEKELDFLKEIELDTFTSSALYNKGYLVLDSTEYTPTGEPNHFEYNLVLENDTIFDECQVEEIDRIISDTISDNGCAVVEIGEYEYVPVA